MVNGCPGIAKSVAIVGGLEGEGGGGVLVGVDGEGGIGQFVLSALHIQAGRYSLHSVVEATLCLCVAEEGRRREGFAFHSCCSTRGLRR